MKTDPKDAPVPKPRDHRSQGAGWRAKVALLVTSLLICLLLSELIARIYWSQHDGITFYNTQNVLYAFYPELQWIDTKNPSKSDEHYDIPFSGRFRTGPLLQPGGKGAS